MVIVIDMPISMLIPALKIYLLPLVFIAWVAFLVLGLALIVSIKKKKAEGPQGLLRKFLLLTGASAVGYLPFILLHNVVSALFGVEEPFFFILAVFVCPLGFLVGAVGTIVLLKKRKRQ